MRLIGAVCLLSLCASVFAQDLSDKAEYDKLKAHATELFNQNNFLAALPELQKLADQNPKDYAVLEALGFALASKALLETDADQRKADRIAARKHLLEAKKLGDNSEMINYLLETTPEDGTPRKFSDNKEIERLMQTAEAHFAKGELNEAKAGYLQVLLLDPENYAAALFTGDVYFKDGKYCSSIQWFQKAIEIDANTETAYRYWGDALDHLGQKDEARRKFMEAVIADPYNNRPWQHLYQWMKTQGHELTVPKIQPQASVNVESDKKINITVNSGSVEKHDGSAAWMTYGIGRAAWQGERFKKEFPNEPKYRHTLREENHALSLVVSSVKSQKDIKQLDPQLATLVKISDAGLLEPYILLNAADQGIAQDYAPYRKEHRDLLYKYLDTIVVPQLKPGL
ncbi:Tetratricopeptide repeat protein [Candidatus Koribacter versatilis Ellin345]|uniref:Tetratricopeptide repeat protein n=1 Tax=Koribacter versatilis (strain Ellin345) TaxID=204669 RepID=Q1IHP9_KORVE|nr:tetratricopeptide repeat protein [Candidatus Koribacter versatilis]ABF43601.1 Tetratricopeptide repeat protein [Candidatus Koribacter versatilis Ellin345]